MKRLLIVAMIFSMISSQVIADSGLVFGEKYINESLAKSSCSILKEFGIKPGKGKRYRMKLTYKSGEIKVSEYNAASANIAVALFLCDKDISETKSFEWKALE